MFAGQYRLCIGRLNENVEKKRGEKRELGKKESHEKKRRRIVPQVRPLAHSRRLSSCQIEKTFILLAFFHLLLFFFPYLPPPPSFFSFLFFCIFLFLQKGGLRRGSSRVSHLLIRPGYHSLYSESHGYIVATSFFAYMIYRL